MLTEYKQEEKLSLTYGLFVSQVTLCYYHFSGKCFPSNPNFSIQLSRQHSCRRYLKLRITAELLKP